MSQEGSLDGEVVSMLRERETWPVVSIDPGHIREARVEQLREVAFATPYQEVEEVAEHVARDGNAHPVRVKAFSGRGAGHRDVVPALVRLHGGGFVMGSPEVEDRESRELANSVGCRVFAPAYRLAPEHPSPAALEDCLAVIRWVIDHADTLRIDPGRISLLGQSAGGYLALASVIAMPHEYRTALRLCVAVEPMIAPGRRTESRLTFADGYLLSTELIDRFWSIYLAGTEPDHRTQDGLRPSSADLQPGPAISILTSGCDPLRDEGEEFADELERCGATVERRRFPGLVHGAINYSGRVPAARRVLDATIATLRESFS